MSGTALSTLKVDPTKILTTNEESSSDILQLLKTVVDPILSSSDNNVLGELFVDGLDASQVWPQVKMVLDSVIEELSFEKIPKLAGAGKGDASQDSEAEEEEEAFGNQLSAEEEQEQIDNDSEDSIDMDNLQDLQDDYEESDIDDEKTLVGSEEEQDDEDEEAEQEQDTETEEKDQDSTTKSSESKSELNDGFFNIDEFNKQILSLDKQANGEDEEDDENDDEEIDYFNDIPESDDEEILYFQDFFNKPKEEAKKGKKSVQFKDGSDEEQEDEEDDEDEEEEDEEKGFQAGMANAMKDMFDEDEEEDEEERQSIKQNGSLSSFERQQLEIQKEIAQLEKEAIADKKWALKGEAKAKERPADSLLQEELEFERTAKPVPVITKESTESLEEMIRRRIKEGNFDDLPKRTIDDLNNFKKSSRFELSEEKSQKSLAELYEDDYKGTNTDEVSEELSKSHEEIKELFKSVAYKLDALSSAHFIPKPMKKALDIKVEASAISMEDATPLTLSDASRLAPQEVYKSGRSSDKSKKDTNKDEIELRSGVVMARSELDREEKQRLRRANKRKRSKEFSADAKSTAKKSKKQDAIDTLSKASNVTIIDNKGVKRDVKGNAVKEGDKKGSSQFRL